MLSYIQFLAIFAVAPLFSTLVQAFPQAVAERDSCADYLQTCNSFVTVSVVQSCVAFDFFFSENIVIDIDGGILLNITNAPTQVNTIFTATTTSTSTGGATTVTALTTTTTTITPGVIPTSTSATVVPTPITAPLQFVIQLSLAAPVRKRQIPGDGAVLSVGSSVGTCNEASVYTIFPNNSVSDTNGVISTDLSAAVMPFQGSAILGPITGEFEIANNDVIWSNPLFEGGQARYCLDASLAVNVVFSGDLPNGCSAIVLGLASDNCLQAALAAAAANSTTSSVSSTSSVVSSATGSSSTVSITSSASRTSPLSSGTITSSSGSPSTTVDLVAEATSIIEAQSLQPFCSLYLGYIDVVTITESVFTVHSQTTSITSLVSVTDEETDTLTSTLPATTNTETETETVTSDVTFTSTFSTSTFTAVGYVTTVARRGLPEPTPSALTTFEPSIISAACSLEVSQPSSTDTSTFVVGGTSTSIITNAFPQTTTSTVFVTIETTDFVGTTIETITGDPFTETITTASVAVIATITQCGGVTGAYTNNPMTTATGIESRQQCEDFCGTVSGCVAYGYDFDSECDLLSQSTRFGFVGGSQPGVSEITYFDQGLCPLDSEAVPLPP